MRRISPAIKPSFRLFLHSHRAMSNSLMPTGTPHVSSRRYSCIIPFPFLTIASNTLTNNRLEWQSLLPDVTPYQAIFDTAAQLAPVPFSAIQPRLENALTLFCHPQSPPRFMLLKAQETREYRADRSRRHTTAGEEYGIPRQPLCHSGWQGQHRAGQPWR